MGVTEKYHLYELDKTTADVMSEEALKEAELENPEQIFEGVIYDKDRIGTRIFRGTQGSQPRVLKVQFLEPDIEEAVIMQDINNRRYPNLRHPHVYDYQDHDPVRGYGYTLMEDVKGRPIFEGLANREEMEEFADATQEIRINRQTNPVFQPKIYERDARTATALRLANWNAIALRKGTLDREGIGHSTRHLLQMTLGDIDKMEFTHGHLTSKDIVVTEKGENVVFSPSFWSYRPKYYETTFQIWDSLKSLEGDEILSPKEAIAHCEEWKETFMQTPGIKEDVFFSRYFASNMRERAIGALLLDINQDHEGEDNRRQKEMFREILCHYS